MSEYAVYQWEKDEQTFYAVWYHGGRFFERTVLQTSDKLEAYTLAERLNREIEREAA